MTVWRDKIVGYRAWRFDDGRLCPVGFREGAAWHAGCNTAVCQRAHVAPAADCTCGLYALRDWWMLTAVGEEGVYGAVCAWGRLEVHAGGFRAQYAEVVAVALHSSAMRSRVGLVGGVARGLGVPFVDLGDLEVVGLEHGVPCPLGPDS